MPSSDADDSVTRHALAASRTADGRSLLELSEHGPVLLIFLRHFG
jgi:hypothetical protein